MLKTAVQSLEKRPSSVLSVHIEKGMKQKVKKAKPLKDGVCFFYNEFSPLPRRSEKNKKDSGTIASRIYVIDIRFSTSSNMGIRYHMCMVHAFV